MTDTQIPITRVKVFRDTDLSALKEPINTFLEELAGKWENCVQHCYFDYKTEIRQTGVWNSSSWSETNTVYHIITIRYDDYLAYS